MSVIELADRPRRTDVHRSGAVACHRLLIAEALLVRGVAACEIISPKRLQPHKLTSFARVRGKRVTYLVVQPKR